MLDIGSYKEELLLKRRELRRNLTPEEAVLWTQLKERLWTAVNGENNTRSVTISWIFIALKLNCVLNLMGKGITLLKVHGKMRLEHLF